MVAHPAKACSNAPEGIKSGKTFFVVSKSLDKVAKDRTGFDKPLGHPLEIVPVANTVLPWDPASPSRCRCSSRASRSRTPGSAFIPRGVELSTEFDKPTNGKPTADGLASFTPNEGNYFLVVVHHEEPDRRGPATTAPSTARR